MLFIAFIGGMLTVLSPCILPVVPFLFAGANRTRLSILLTLVGMALTFALISSLAVVSTEWVAGASNFGRQVALVVMVLFALSLMFARVGDWVTRPFIMLGNVLDPINRGISGIPGSVLIGVATGLLWAPCAGPILGGVLTSAMLEGASVDTSLLLVAYGLGSAMCLGFFIFAGHGIVNRFKPSMSVVGWMRRGGGVAMLIGAAVVSTGTDSVLPSEALSEGIGDVEKRVLKHLPEWTSYLPGQVKDRPKNNGLGAMPSLSGAVEWINSPALTNDSLKGKIVLVDFWTFDCINCKRDLPFVKLWAEKYEKEGLLVIGVHTPEYGFERIVESVKNKVKEYGITFPVAIDNNNTIWRSFYNQYWPAHYLIDAKGQVRFTYFGEGNYEDQENMIRQLLEEAKANVMAYGRKK